MERTTGRARKRGPLPVVLLGALCVFYSSTISFSAAGGIFFAPLGLLSCAADPSLPETDQKAAKPSRTAVKPVTVYVTSWCPACRMTTDYLEEKKIPFKVKDIEKNSDYFREMVDKVGAYRGVPVLDIDGKIVLGFNPYILDELVK